MHSWRLFPKYSIPAYRKYSFALSEKEFHWLNTLPNSISMIPNKTKSTTPLISLHQFPKPNNSHPFPFLLHSWANHVSSYCLLTPYFLSPPCSYYNPYPVTANWLPLFFPKTPLLSHPPKIFPISTRPFHRTPILALITNSSERPIIERSNNRYFGNDLLGTCSLHFTCQQYKGSNVMITIICLKIVYH